jgi:hypothetical protein
MKLNLPSDTLSPSLVILLWLVYLVVYWRALFQILAGDFMGTQEKILWFLVITLAPVIGIITYWMIFTPERRREGQRVG